MPLTYRRLRPPPGELTAAALRASLLERGLDVEPDATIMLSQDEAMAVAAEYASRGAGPLALPRRERMDARLRSRRNTSARLLTAAVLLVLSAALEMWDVKRERTNVDAARMRIQRSLSEALAVRESLSVVNERLGAVRSLDSNAPHWSTWVARLAERLPPDAFLVSLSGAGDSLRLEGAATRAAPVFDALSAVPGVRNVRPDGPIRQEVRGGDAASEHFLISASLDRREMAAAGRTP
jgi:Tfp pilus assembly protein PilN